MAVLREQLGTDVDRSESAALRLAEHCGGLPLALRIVAAAAHLSAGEADLAPAAHTRALAIARVVGDRYEQARALEGIGTAGGDAERWREALAIYREPDLDEAERVAARPARET